MIGIIQVGAAPYRDRTFQLLNAKCKGQVEVATFPDGMDTHPEWKYTPLKEDYVGKKPKQYYLFGRIMAFNSDIKGWLKSYKWDLLIIEGYNSITNLYAICYASMHGIPIILGLDSIENPGHKRLKSFLYSRMKAFWVPGKRSEKYLLSEGVKKEKIYQGKYTYDLNEVKSHVESYNKNNIRVKYNIKPDAIVLLFIGKLIPTRNVAQLLNAFSCIQDKKLHLIIIGNGPDEDKVKKYEDNRLTYIPQVPLSELYKYYAISDVYIHPGREPYSLAVVQAVAADLVIISSKEVGAVDDVVENNKNGITFSYGDEKGIKDSILKVVKNYQRMKMGAITQGMHVRSNRSVEYASNQLYEAVKYASGKYECI